MMSSGMTFNVQFPGKVSDTDSPSIVSKSNSQTMQHGLEKEGLEKPFYSEEDKNKQYWQSQTLPL